MEKETKRRSSRMKGIDAESFKQGDGRRLPSLVDVS